MYHSKFPVAPRWIAKARIEKWKVALFASAGFVALFGFFLTWFLYRPDRDARAYDDMDNQADPIKRNEQLPTPSFRLMGSLATTREK